MKKYVVLILSVLLLSVTANAQKAKFGHIDYAAIMKLMPGIDTAQTAIVNYQKELQETGEQMTNEFKQKEAEYNKLSTTGASTAILKVKEDELTTMYKRIQDFATASQQDVQNKQVELLKPFQDKMLAAIKKVADAGHYAYVFDTSTLAFYAPSDDLTAQIKAELGIKDVK